MTAMLASIKSIAEAHRAFRAGVDVVDCKDPEVGALGALSPCLIRAIVRDLGGKTCISAAAGELPADAGVQADAVLPIADSGVDFVKVGLPSGVGGQAWAKTLGHLSARGIRVIAVLFADRLPPPGLLTDLAAAGVSGAMLDTADKSGGGLCARLSPVELSEFIDRARNLGLMTGLAGSIKVADISSLLRLRPDYIGFRGALCRDGGRAGELDDAATRAVRHQLDRGRQMMQPETLKRAVS